MNFQQKVNFVNKKFLKKANNLLKKLLEIDPNKRISTKEAL